MPKLTKTEDALTVSLQGYRGEFMDAVAAIKAIPGARFDGQTKLWSFPLDPHAAERVITAIRPEANVDTMNWIKEAKAQQQAELVTPLPSDATIELPWADRLKSWQRALVDFAATQERMICADDMGLGKTVEAIASIETWKLRKQREDGPKLIVCPSSVKGAWAREVVKWLGSSYPHQIVDASTAPKRVKQIEAGIADNGYVIVNYEQVRAKEVEEERPVYTSRLDGSKRKTMKKVTVDVIREPLFAETPWIAAIADEAHRMKNRKALTSRGMWRVDAGMKIALTGTPVQNSPDELWSILRWLYPERYNSNGSAKNPKTAYWTFFNSYVDYYETNHGKVITGVKNPDSLRFELSHILKRRTKGQMVKLGVLDLPDKTRQIVPVELSPAERKVYKEAEKQLWLEIEQEAKQAGQTVTDLYTIPNGAARTLRLRQIISTLANLGGDDVSSKLDTAVDLIMDAQPKQFGVFTEFVPTAHALVERLSKKGLRAVAYTGNVDSVQRTEYEDQFQAGEIDVIVGTIGAMKEGITLTAADTAIFIELPWVPSVRNQCEDRFHRVGQKNAVTSIILEATSTVDDGKLGPTNSKKEMIVSQVIQTDHVEEKAA